MAVPFIRGHIGCAVCTSYHHFANREEILDGIVDLAFGEIEFPVAGGDWRAEVTRRSASVRAVLRRHPWAISLMESRSAPGPATLRQHDAMLGTLRAAGLSLPMMGSVVFGREKLRRGTRKTVAEGISATEIAPRVGATRTTVIVWRARF